VCEEVPCNADRASPRVDFDIFSSLLLSSLVVDRGPERHDLMGVVCEEVPRRSNITIQGRGGPGLHCPGMHCNADRGGPGLRAAPVATRRCRSLLFVITFEPRCRSLLFVITLTPGCRSGPNEARPAKVCAENVGCIDKGSGFSVWGSGFRYLPA